MIAIANKRYLPEQRKILKVMLLIEYLFSGKRLIKEVAAEYGISERTAYRYIRLLESLGFAIDQDFENRFFIVENTCPMCGKKRIEHE